MKDNQIPQKEFSRKSLLKKPQKNSKKSLNDSFNSVSEDSSSEITKESTDLSTISEISADNHHIQISVISGLESTGDFSPSSDTFPPSSLTPTSKSTAISDDRINGFATRAVEADIVANLLKQARTQVLNSGDVDFRSKKLLDELIKFVVGDFCSLPDRKDDRVSELVSMNIRIVFLCFLLWSFAVSVMICFGVGFNSSYSGPLPT